MLILGRSVGETIKIDGGIEIVVQEVHRGTVRLGIVAPPAVKVLRGELADQRDPGEDLA